MCEKSCTAHKCHCNQWGCNSNCFLHDVSSLPFRQNAPLRPEGHYHNPPRTGKSAQLYRQPTRVARKHPTYSYARRASPH
jgi:hypothetical protein